MECGFPSGCTIQQRQSDVRLSFRVARGSIVPGRAFDRAPVKLMLAGKEADALPCLLGRRRM
jgi:hypothetical protein